MSAWVAIAAKEAATTTSLGSGILHGISDGALDGFAVGAMLTGLCFLMIVAPRSFQRPRLSARQSLWPSFIRRPLLQRDYFAAPGEVYAVAADPYSLSAESEMVFSAAPVAEEAEDTKEAADLELAEDFAGHAGADPYAIETAVALDAEPVLDLNEAPVEEQAPAQSGRGYRSRHRMIDQESGERRPESRRSAPKHAAPSTRFRRRMSSKLAIFPLVAARG
jgi:hypothetical protein